MADNDYASETSSERFPLRDFSETPRKDSTPTEPNSAAVEETKSFGPTYNDDAQNEAHHNETSGWGTNPSAASSSSAGYLVCGTSSQESYGMSRRSAREPKNFHQWSGDQKRRVGGVVNKLGEKNSTIRGLMDFEFKNFMTISHVQVLYKNAMIRGGILWTLVIVLSFLGFTLVGIGGIFGGETLMTLVSIVGFLVVALVATSVYFNYLVRKRLNLEERVAIVRIAQNTGDALDKMD